MKRPRVPPVGDEPLDAIEWAIVRQLVAIISQILTEAAANTPPPIVSDTKQRVREEATSR